MPRSGLSAPVAVCLLIDTLIWLLVSIEEQNIAILAIHLLLLVSSATVIRSCSPRSLEIFVAALLPRSILTVLPWYLAFNNDRKFYIGTNPDPTLFWDAATMTYEQASNTFEDPLFPRLNVLVTNLSDAISGVSYLATTQTIIFAGTMLAVFSFLLVSDLYGRRVGRLTGYLMAFSPSAIAFSTGLMRDSLIGMFGFMFLFALNRALISKRASLKILLLGVIISSIVALAYLRSISLAGFIIAGLLLLFSKTRHQPSTVSRAVKVWIIAILLAGTTFAVIDRTDRFEDIFTYAIKVRAGDGSFGNGIGKEVNPDGITTKIAEASPALFALISPLALLQPLPFYAWDTPDYIGGPPAPIEIVIGFGGLFNQLLFGFYIIAIHYWIKTKDSFGLRIGLGFTLFVCTLTLVGLGAIRMVVAHCYPLYYMGVSVALVQVCKMRPGLAGGALLRWLGSLLAMYGGYLALRELNIPILAIPLFGFALYFLWLLWQVKAPKGAQVRSKPPTRQHQLAAR